jgi:hypothetical protein
MDTWWAGCIRNDQERKWINDVIKRVRADSHYVFTRAMYEDALERRQDTGSLEIVDPASSNAPTQEVTVKPVSMSLKNLRDCLKKPLFK